MKNGRAINVDATGEQMLSRAVPEIGLYIPARLSQAGRDFGCPFWVLFLPAPTECRGASKKVQ